MCGSRPQPQAGLQQNQADRRAGGGRHRLPASAGAGQPQGEPPAVLGGTGHGGRAVFQSLLDKDPAPQALDELFALAAKETVAVLCFEQDEDRCHRKVICDMARADHGLHVAALG